MLGLLYLFLCFGVGWVICSYAFPDLGSKTLESYNKGRIDVSPYLLKLPAWFITGVLALTWPVYLIACLTAKATAAPLNIANAIVMPIALIVFGVIYYRKQIRHKGSDQSSLDSHRGMAWTELLLVVGITVLACVLMWSTFYVKEGQLRIGVSVFSDFSPHIGMIRSFSYGNNFPTSYSHFGGEDIKYHFMFQFLVGNLEYLGLRIDYAFNLPSSLSFISAFLLFYVLAVKITGKKLTGLLACLFFAFRSSKSLFTYLAGLPKGELLQTLRNNIDFIGSTPNEEWGLWNLNVYCNQRHLAFGLAVMFFLLILYLPPLYELFEAVKQLRHQSTTERTLMKSGSNSYLKLIFFTGEGWKVKELKTAIASGILLGALTFFHGAIVIGCLLILFMVAAFSRR